MAKIFSIIFLASLPLPVPLFGIPLSNVMFLLYFLFVFSEKFHQFSITRYSYTFLLVFVLLILSVLRSSNLYGIDELLGLARYSIALLPLFLFEPLTKTLSKERWISIDKLLYLSFTSFIVLSSFALTTNCSTTYGGPCVMMQNSSSFGAAACSLIILCLTLLWNHSSNYIFPRIFFLFSGLFFFAFGIIQGSRMFWILLLIPSVYIFLKVLNPFRILRKSKIKAWPIVAFAGVLITTFLFSTTLASKMSYSLLRLFDLIANPLSDVRISQGFIFGSKLNIDSVSFLFGSSVFSHLDSWNSTSVYDSTVNLLVSDFGLISSSLLIIFIAINLVKYRQFLIIFGFSCAPLIFCILLYIVGSLSNEFILLKAFNPLFVFLVSITSAYCRTRDIAVDASTN